MPLISESVRESLITQLGMEKYNANLYLSIASMLKGKGLDNLAKIFESQHDEEEEHAKLIYKLLTDLNESFNLPQIDECNVAINSILDVGELYLSREVETTNSLKEIRIQAADESNGGCPVVEVFMIKMLKKQQAELAEATSFRDKSSLFPEWWQVALWDSSMGE